MNIFRKNLLGTRGLVAVFALMLTAGNCESEVTTEPGPDDAQVDEIDPDDESDRLVAENPEPDAETIALAWQVTLAIFIDHPGGIALMGFPEDTTCDANSGGLGHGTVEGPIDGLPDDSVALQLYLDANGNGVFDPGEETGEPRAGTIGANGEITVGAPLQQYGDHGIALFSVGGLDLTQQAAAMGTITVSDPEGDAAEAAFEFTLPDAPGAVVDTSAFATCP